MDNGEILKRVIDLFSVMTEAEHIQEDSELIDDLDVSSMDILFLASSMEEEFNIKITEREIRKMETVGDVVDIIASLLNK